MELPRRSHFIRAGFHSWEQFTDWVEATSAASTKRVSLFEPDACGSLADLMPSLLEDYARIVKTHQNDTTLTTITRWPRPGYDRLEWLRNGTISAQVGVDCEENVVLTISAGLCLALDDAILTVFSRPSVPNGWSEALFTDAHVPVLICGPENVERYTDYTIAFGGDPSHHRRDRAGVCPVTRSLPLDLCRLATCDLILELAIRWVLFHEEAHIMLGHLKYAAAQNRSTGLSALIDETSFQIEGGKEAAAFDRRCMEMQADLLAMQMLCTLAFSKDFAKSGRLAAISSRASHPGGETGWEHDPDPALIMRLCTLAATTACLIFDRRRERLGTTRSTPMLAHPTPSARILNLAHEAVAAFGDFVGAGNDPDDETAYDTDRLDPAFREVIYVFAEMEIVARAIGLGRDFYRTTVLADHYADERRARDTPLEEDFFEFLRRGAGQVPRPFVTAAGDEFWSMRERSAKLYEEFRAFTKIW